MPRFMTITAVLVVLLVRSASAQETPAEWAATLANGYRIAEDITYLTANSWDAKLDVYVPRTPGPHPTILHIHGGGWVGGSRHGVILRMMPYLEMGMAVVNVSYRLAAVSPAPAAVEDVLCALRWIVRNAADYDLDPDRVVSMGYSAGGHLALTTGMVPASAGLDRQCPGPDLPRLAAVVNWYGITDVADLLDGPNTKTYAVQWLGSREDRLGLAAKVSPLTYVRRDLPPILTIHGDADPTVPYTHATRLHADLTAAGALSELLTIPRGGHGNFPPEQQQRAVAAVRQFLLAHTAAGEN